ncbi:MAG: response regulator [Prochlorothrix sp.]|nr:response regulator [Prochlorothrix sp.]
MESSPDQQSAGSILIIDDVPENIRVLSHLLQQQGYILRKAVNGKLGIRSAKLLPPDLILLDIKMPQMDGYTVCQVLRKDPTTADIPIIFMSALDETLNKVRAFEVGGQDYITKPFQLEEVLVRIKSQMTLQAQRLQLHQEIQQRKITEDELQESR